MTDDRWLAEQFERHRPYLRSVAYRMLGSPTESEDAVQEAWLRLSRTRSEIENPAAWLTTVIGRVCIDMLRARRSRREDYVGSWLPEPVVSVDTDPGPEESALIADSVGLALLVVLETLSPRERVAFVLHDMFAVPFDEIGPIIEASPAAARQLASRARRAVQGAAPDPDPDVREQRRLVDAFLAASRAGDFEALIEILDPGVVFRVDVGRGGRRGARPPIEGAPAVARRVLARGSRLAPFARPALVNGAAGLLVGPPESPFAVVGFTISGGRIVEIDLITDPDTLPRPGRGR